MLTHSHLQIDTNSTEESKRTRIGCYIGASFHRDVRRTEMIGREESRLEREHDIGLVGTTTEALITDAHESRAHEDVGAKLPAVPRPELVAELSTEKRRIA